MAVVTQLPVTSISVTSYQCINNQLPVYQ